MRQQDNSICDDILEMADHEGRGDGNDVQLLTLHICWACISSKSSCL